MTTADEMRSIQSASLASKQNEELLIAQKEYRAKEDKRLEIMSRAKELFEPVLDKIKEEAKRGYSLHSVPYDGNIEDEEFKIEAIAHEARSHGFRTERRREDANMGDSAAPGWTTFYWLNISWTK